MLKLPKQYERLDAAESIFFNRELETISAELFEVPIQQLKGLQFVPAYTQIEPTDEFWTYRVWDYSGKAKRIKDMSEDSPPADLGGVETQQRLVSFGESFRYSIDELRASARYNRPLDRARAQAARAINDQKLDDICATGDSTDLFGLLNLSGTDTYATPDAAGGGGTPKAFASKTADEILTDMGAMISQVRKNTKEVESPKRLVLPTSQMELVKRKRVSTVSDTTVLQFFRETNPDVEVLSWTKLAGAGSGASDRMIAYDPNPAKVRLLLPILFEQQPPERKGWAYKVECRMKTGGVIAIRPKSIIYGDNI